MFALLLLFFLFLFFFFNDTATTEIYTFSLHDALPIFTGGELTGRITGKVLPGGADYQNLSPPATIDARYLWQTAEGEIIIVRNGGAFGSLAPTFEVRVDSPYAWLNTGTYLSSNPEMRQGGVGLTFFDSTR